MTNKKPQVTFPTDKPRIGLLLQTEQIRSIYEARAKQNYEKLLLLCDFHNIKKDEHWQYNLALALAQKLYPEPKKEGVKAKWTDLIGGCLVVEMERLIKSKENPSGCTAPSAADQLAKKEPWFTFLDESKNGRGHNKAESIKTAFKKYRKAEFKFTNVVRDGFKYHEITNSIPEWEEFVINCTNKI